MIKLVSALCLIAQFAISSPVFHKNSPEPDLHCPTWDISRFENVEYYFTVGVDTAVSYGFDYEIPISRDGVTTVFCSLGTDAYQSDGQCPSLIDWGSQRPFYQYSSDRPMLSEYFNTLEEEYDYFQSYVNDWIEYDQVSYFNVGSVLEYLSRLYLQDLYEIFPTDQYNVTGGVLYRHGSGNTVGELDIIVYDRYTCDVIAIGESKASSSKTMKRALRKAKNQLSRIADFLSSYLGPQFF